MFKKTLIMSVATAGLACSVAFAANGMQPKGHTQIGVTFASDLDMLGTPYADPNEDLSLINNVKVGFSMFNWDYNIALWAGFGVKMPDSDSGLDNTYHISLSALKLFDILRPGNYMTAGLSAEYFNAQSEGQDDQPTNLRLALGAGFMHKIDSLNSIFSVTIPVFETSTTTNPVDGSDNKTDISLFSGAEVSWSYLFK